MSYRTSSPAAKPRGIFVYSFEVGLTISALSSPAPNDKIYYWHDVYSRYNNVFPLITFSWRVGIHEELRSNLNSVRYQAFIRTVDATIKTTSLNSIRCPSQIILLTAETCYYSRNICITAETYIHRQGVISCYYRRCLVIVDSGILTKPNVMAVTYVVRPALGSLYPSVYFNKRINSSCQDFNVEPTIALILVG